MVLPLDFISVFVVPDVLVGVVFGFFLLQPAISAAVINEGGLMMFVFVKFALVLAGAAAVLLTLRWVRTERPGAVALYVFTLAAIRGSTVALALVSLHNAFLLKSL